MNETDNNISNSQPEIENEIILYQPDSTLSLDVRVENETVWLTQQQMSELFQRDRTVITRHTGRTRLRNRAKGSRDMRDKGSFI